MELHGEELLHKVTRRCKPSQHLPDAAVVRQLTHVAEVMKYRHLQSFSAFTELAKNKTIETHNQILPGEEVQVGVFLGLPS